MEPQLRRVSGEKTGRNPTDRGKPGPKHNVIVQESGRPLDVVIDGANVHDTTLLEATIEAIVVERPQPTPKQQQHLCLDKGYDNPTGRQAAVDHQYTPHIRRIGQQKAVPRGDNNYKPRRWVVERTLAWLSKCRAILVRYDKHWFNYLGLIQLACALLWFRRLHRLSTA